MQWNYVEMVLEYGPPLNMHGGIAGYSLLLELDGKYSTTDAALEHIQIEGVS